MKNYLEFEKEIKALEQEVDNLKSPFGSEGISEVDTQKIKNTQNEINEKLKETYANLNSLSDEDWDNIRDTIKKSNEKDKKQRTV